MKATKTPVATKTTTLKVPDKTGTLSEEKRAALATSPGVTSALVCTTFARRFGEVDLTATAEVLRQSAERIHGDDLREVETMLATQAIALNNIFTETALRAATNMGEYLGAAETYLKLALKAQSQCRATLETLATIKHPPVVIAKQANIAHGHQQVNNHGDTAHILRVRADETQKSPTELLGHEHGERLEPGTTSTAGRSDPALAAVATVHRPAQRARQGRIKP